MSIDKSQHYEPSPFMGERTAVSLLSELGMCYWLLGTIDISPLRGFSRQTLTG